jgi:hypothetical protein
VNIYHLYLGILDIVDELVLVRGVIMDMVYVLDVLMALDCSLPSFRDY